MISKLSGIALLATLSFSHSAAAHDAWIELAAPAETGTSDWQARFYVGHGEDLTFWPAEPARVSTFANIAANGVTDMLSYIPKPRTGDALTFSLDEGPSSIIAISSFRAENELSAEAFNDYVTKEGILPIASHRLLNDTMSDPGREVYARDLKAIALGEDEGCDLSVIGRPIGQTLEIIPLTHPGEGCSDEMVFELRYFGNPVAGATMFWNRTDIVTDAVRKTTNALGQVTFERPETGMWYAHSVWSMPVDAERFGGDFATTFSSLSMRFKETSE